MGGAESTQTRLSVLRPLMPSCANAADTVANTQATGRMNVRSMASPPLDSDTGRPVSLQRQEAPSSPFDRKDAHHRAGQGGAVLATNQGWPAPWCGRGRQ